MLIWSLATAFVPVAAGFMPGLLLSRVLVSFPHLIACICETYQKDKRIGKID